MENKKVILLVEDEALIAMNTSMQLQKEGFEVRTALTGEQAIVSVGEAEPDLVVMDIDLGPGLDGTQTARLILASHEIPVLFLSSHAEDEIVQRTQDIAGYGYVLKYAGFGILLASIRMALKLMRFKEEQARYDLLFRNMASGFALHEIILDAAGEPCDYRFLEINPAFEELTGLKGSDILGKTVKEVMPDTEDEWIKEYGKVALEGTNTTLSRYAQSLGKHFKVNAFSPKIGRFAVVFNDVTDLVKTSDELRENQDLIKQFFGIALDLFCVADTSGTFIKLNPQWESLLGYSIPELEGRKFMDFVHPDDHENTLRTLQDLSSGKQIINFVNRYRCKDGAWKSIEWRSRAVGDVIYAAARDITEQDRMQKNLAVNLEEKKMLIREMQHRIKNNLLTISSILGLEQERVKEPESRQVLEETRNRIGVMMLVYNQLYQNDDQANLSLKNYLSELLENLHNNCNSDKIELRADIEDVKLDSKRAVNTGIIINEIMTNSCKYAFKPGEPGVMTVRLRRDGGNIEIFCRDTGKGYPENFETIHSESLGLILMQSKAAEMKGNISFFNDNGACCRLTFPL